MSIITKIKDGAGSAVRATVFDNKLRELEIQQSAANFISTAQLGGRTGVFTVTRGARAILSATEEGVLLSISNNDPINLLIIDYIYLQIVSSTITLPDTRLIAGLSRRSASSTGPPILNENKNSKIIPLTTSKQATSLPPSTLESLRIYPTLGDIIEFIPQNIDSIILPGKGTPAPGISDFNTLSVSLFSTTSPTIVSNVFIRFMVVPPDQLG